MNFQFDEEPKLLADSLAKLIERDYDFEARKRFIASNEGRNPDAWRAMAEIGVFSLTLSERAGGFALGALDCVPVMEQVGRGLLVEPVVDTFACARLLDRLGGDESQALLAGAIAGDSLLGLAHLEADGEPGAAGVTTRASRSGDQWVLNGAKHMVIHAPAAEHLLVTARTSGEPGQSTGLSLFAVPTGAAGLQMRTLRTVDNFRAADVSLHDCKAAILIGQADEAAGAIDEALDFATMLLCAEAVGIMDFANETTLDYLKTRKQFGVAIGNFQALQHRMVDMVISAQQARSIVYLGCDAVDKAAAGEASHEHRRRQVSAARIKVDDAARHIGQEAVQLHGGMGMTNEMKISHAFKRLTMITQMHGDVDHHLARFAALARE